MAKASGDIDQVATVISVEHHKENQSCKEKGKGQIKMRKICGSRESVEHIKYRETPNCRMSKN